jgi:hypothetical protein
LKLQDSIYALALQRSNYLAVDNDLMHSLHLFPNKLQAMISDCKNDKDFDRITETDKIRDVTDKVYIKYKNKNEV